MKASDLFVKCLEQEGVRYIFAVPGEENLDMIESLRSSSIQLIVTRHEQSAGFMAATYGRLTGETGVCLATLGPGATNLMTAVAYAQLGGMPVLFITGQKPVKKSKQGRFQMVHVTGMMKPLTQATRRIVHGDAIPSSVRESFRVSQEERPGAVHLEIPEDVAREKTSARPYEVVYPRRPIAEEKAIRRAVEMIEGARRPLLLIGAAANRKQTTKMLRQFIDKTNIYFFNTQMGKGVVDERHSRFLGTAALSENDYLHDAIEKADLIINVGHDTVEKPPFLMRRGGFSVIHINYFPAHIDDIYFPHAEVVGDIANALWQMKELVRPQQWENSDFERVKQLIDSHLSEKETSGQYPLLPQRIVADIRAAVPDDGIVSLDNGMYKIWFARNYRAYGQNTLLLDNALASMGAGLPSAIAAKLLFPQRRVVAVCGDGGFMMNSQELETAVRLRLDICVVIIRDDAYGMIQWKQESLGMKPFGLSFGNPDFVAYAESYGARGHHVSRAEDFRPLLERCLNAGGVHVIEVPVDYSENKKVFENKEDEDVSFL